MSGCGAARRGKVKEAAIVPIAATTLPNNLLSSAIIALSSRYRPACQGPLAEPQARPACRAAHGVTCVLPVAQWIVHMPPKRGILVRFQSGGPPPNIRQSQVASNFCLLSYGERVTSCLTPPHKLSSHLIILSVYSVGISNQHVPLDTNGERECPSATPSSAK